MQELITLLDQQLIELTNYYNKYNIEYASIQEKIENMEAQRDHLEHLINGIETSIYLTKQKIIEIQILETDYSSDDPFEKDFFYASFFANRENDSNRPLYEHINITDNELWASDTRRGIIIKNNNIPSELRNTIIKWDVRDNFASNINKNVDRPYPDLKQVINQEKNAAECRVENITAKDFYRLFKLEPVVQGEHRIIAKISCLGMEIMFNKFYIDIALKCLENMQFTVLIKDRESPIVFDNDAMSIIIMPIF